MKDILPIAIKAIFTNKARSFLTMLGVIIGVGSVVLLTSIGNGLSAFVTDQFNELGANTLFIMPGDIFGEGGGFSQEGAATSIANSKLRLRDITDIERLRKYVDEVSMLNMQSDKISFRSDEKSTTVLGTNAALDTAFNINTEKGRFFTESEDNGAKRVVVLGFEVANELFGQIDPIGKKVKIGDQTFKIIGVGEKKGGGFGGPSFDTYTYIPFKTFSKMYDSESILRIIVKTKSSVELKDAIREIEQLLNKRLDDDEFSVIDQSEILSTINQILGVLTVGLGGIAAISLVVGGIGIMNIMLVSVTERTREIGLRKALGATPNMILTQFLIEAAVLSIFGGFIGIAIAYGGSLLLQAYMPAKVTVDAVLLAFGISTAVGLIFGAAPAKKAADLSPIEALRYE
ncbi:ABC transporter permease [Patescibacteria group bacterium]